METKITQTMTYDTSNLQALIAKLFKLGLKSNTIVPSEIIDEFIIENMKHKIKYAVLEKTDITLSKIKDYQISNFIREQFNGTVIKSNSIEIHFYLFNRDYFVWSHLYQDKNEFRYAGSNKKEYNEFISNNDIPF